MTILDWLDKNKEWLFSGVGVALLGYVGTLIWRRFHPAAKSKNEAVVIVQVSNEQMVYATTSGPRDETPPVHITKITPITITEITQALEKAPPLQQDSVGQHYIGLNVQWQAQLFGAEKDNDDNVRLTLDFGNANPNLVFCNVRLSEYRELGVLQKGAPITVMGRIRKVAPRSASLEDVRLFFHGPLNDNRA